MLIPSKHCGYQTNIRICPEGGGGGKGGGGSSAPPPDPRLVQAQITSMGYQDEAIKAMLANNADMAPLQKEQLQFGLSSAKTAYGQAQDDRTFALGRRDIQTGLQNTMTKDAQDFNAEGRQEQMAQQAGEDVSGAYSGMRGQVDRSMASRGISANSGAALAATASMGNAQAMAQASAINKTRDAARAEGFALTDRANSAMAGYSTQASGNTGQGAGYGASGLGMANSALTGMNSGYSAAGTMAGQMGSNATGMYGAQASYKNSQDQIAASSDPMNAILGAASGVGMAYGLNKFK